MAKMHFEIELIGHMTLELDEAVIQAVNDEWRKQLFNLKNPDEIARFIARLMAVEQLTLSQIEGWADQPDSNAKIFDVEWDSKVL
jgi:hypothetical protein